MSLFMFRRWQPDLLIFDLLHPLVTLLHCLLPTWLLRPRWSRVYEMPLPRAVPASTDAEPKRSLSAGEIEFRWATAADSPLLESRFGERLISTRLSYGHRAAVLVKGKKLIGIAWFATRGYYDVATGTRVTLSFDEAWIYGAWIHRRYRGCGLYSHLLRSASVELRRRGVRHLLFANDAINIRSKRVHRKLHAKPIGRLYGVRLAFYNAYRFHREPVTPRA